MSDTFNPGDRVQGRRSGRLGTVTETEYVSPNGLVVPVRWDEEPERVASMYPYVLYRLSAPTLDRTKVQEAYRAVGKAIDANHQEQYNTSLGYLLRAQALLEEADA